jgi:CIC family chloride channel protein
VSGLTRLVEALRSSEHTLLLLLAALLGLLGGFGSVLFRQLIRLVQRVSWGEWTYTLDAVRAHPWWWIVITPAVGGLIVGVLVTRFAQEARGHGVPEVMEAVALRSGLIRPRLVAVKTLASALTIGTGGSVGREGPIVQIGSALGSALGQWTRVSGPQLRTLVGCGAAAGIAGTFNAPVAGALFAVEVVLGDFAVAAFSPIVISSVMATVVSRHYLGDFPAFVVPPHELVSGWELGAYAVLGVVAAGVALAFIALLYGMEDRLERLPGPAWLRPALGGAVVGAVALVFPEVLGVGYEATTEALTGQLGLATVATLVLVKMAATSVTLGTGGSGGVFAPSLFLGAMTGSLVGGLANQWLPALTGTQGAYALVGMGAVVAGTTQAPITAILIIFELTSDYKLILPLMASVIIATVVTTRVRRTSIYTEKLHRRGVDLFRGHELNILRSLRTEDVMDRDAVTIGEARPLGELLDLLSRSPRPAYYVLDEEDRYVGLLRRQDLQEALVHAEALLPVMVARDFVDGHALRLAPDTPLDQVMRIFAEKHPEELPVVEPGTDRVVGTLTRRHLLDAYNQELMKRDMAAGLAGRLDAARTSEMPVGEDYVMLETDAPTAFVGRTLRELEVRRRYGVQVLLVRRQSPGTTEWSDLVPDGDTRVEPFDRVVLLGRAPEVQRFRH